MPPQLQLVVLLLVGWVSQRQQAVIHYLLEENRVLREQVGGRRLRFTPEQRARLAQKGKALGRELLGEYASLATPDTILRWYRQLIAKKYDSSGRRKPGRPRTATPVAELVLRMAADNPTLGYTRLSQALWNVGHEISRSTVRRILLEHGVEPAPERKRKTTWKQFLAAHWDALAAADFFSVEVLTWRGLARYQVFFVIHLATRRVQIAGITADPHAGRMQQVARNLIDADEGFLRDMRYLILDRDPLYTAQFRRMLANSGTEPLRLPPRSPNLNPHAERFVLSIKSECTSRLVILGEQHLRHVVREYVAHYHTERNHQGLGGALIDPGPTAGRVRGRVVRRARLGGLLNYYHRAAA